MNQKYKATGIVLKGTSLKENDRLITVLTPEYGLIRAVAPGAKKYKSQLRGRTELFVINEFLIISGRSLDKIIQADTIYTHPGLSRDIGKLATAQYLAELAIALAVDEQPQPEIYQVLIEHLRQIEAFAVGESVYPYLARAVFDLLTVAGLSPQVFDCSVTQRQISPNFTAVAFCVGFSFEAGGIVALETIQTQEKQPELDDEENYNVRLPKIDRRLNAIELAILQHLNSRDVLISASAASQPELEAAWVRIEQLLREYIQYHIGKTIRSANLVDNLYAEF